MTMTSEDNVFVKMVVAVQYYVSPERVYDAFYKREDAKRQITSFVFHVVRARVCQEIKLDDVFEKKDEIADIVKSELAQVMAWSPASWHNIFSHSVGSEVHIMAERRKPTTVQERVEASLLGGLLLFQGILTLLWLR